MKAAKTLWILLLPVAAFGLWAMLAGPRALFGIDPGPLGMSALVASTVAALLLLSRTPRERLEGASPAEHFMIANLLAFGLMGHWLVECAATALMYLMDRRGARA